MTQLERFTALLDEMNVSYETERIVYDSKLTGDTVVFIHSRAEGFVNWSDGDGAAVLFNNVGTCTNWT